jgi:hypothetical protein
MRRHLPWIDEIVSIADAGPHGILVKPATAHRKGNHWGLLYQPLPIGQDSGLGLGACNLAVLFRLVSLFIVSTNIEI